MFLKCFRLTELFTALLWSPRKSGSQKKVIIFFLFFFFFFFFSFFFYIKLAVHVCVWLPYIYTMYNIHLTQEHNARFLLTAARSEVSFPLLSLSLLFTLTNRTLIYLLVIWPCRKRVGETTMEFFFRFFSLVFRFLVFRPDEVRGSNLIISPASICCVGCLLPSFSLLGRQVSKGIVFIAQWCAAVFWLLLFFFFFCFSC